MKIYILLLVYFFHGGLVETQSITAPTFEDCKLAEAHYYLHNPKGTKIDGKVLDKLGQVCLEVTE